MNIEEKFRAPNAWERAVLERLFEADFSGKNELEPMLAGMQVRTIDEEGSVELKTTRPERAAVVKTVPVEAQAKDRDGIHIHFLFHVREGRPYELEIYKDDGSPIKSLPQPHDLEIIVLGP